MGKLWDAFYGQLNKMVNWFWEKDPVAQMQLEYDRAVVQLKDGREGLEQYRSLVERVSRQVKNGEQRKQEISAKIKACLKTGDRESAGQLAIRLAETDKELAENQEQLELHEKSYQNNLEKIKYATKNLSRVREKIKTYEADLKMSEAEAQMAKLSQSFNFDITTDFGQIEQVMQEKIDLNRAKVRVAADMSEESLKEIEIEKKTEAAMAEDLLAQFEIDMGIKTPETTSIPQTTKELGPEQAEETTSEPEKETE